MKRIATLRKEFRDGTVKFAEFVDTGHGNVRYIERVTWGDGAKNMSIQNGLSMEQAHKQIELHKSMGYIEMGV